MKHWSLKVGTSELLLLLLDVKEYLFTDHSFRDLIYKPPEICIWYSGFPMCVGEKFYLFKCFVLIEGRD